MEAMTAPVELDDRVAARVLAMHVTAAVTSANQQPTIPGVALLLEPVMHQAVKLLKTQGYRLVCED